MTRNSEPPTTLAEAVATGAFAKARKYHNVPVTYHGFRFDSKAERDHYQLLYLRWAFGEITDLVLQPHYDLQDERIINGKHQRGPVYVADFTYIEDGRRVVVDVKGVETAVFKLKRKLFEARYPDIRLLIVTTERAKGRRR